MNYCYFEFDKGNIQDLMFSKRVDPRTFAVNIDVTFGNLEIHKTSEDEKISNITFTVKGNGKTRLKQEMLHKKAQSALQKQAKSFQVLM